LKTAAKTPKLEVLGEMIIGTDDNSLTAGSEFSFTSILLILKTERY